MSLHVTRSGRVLDLTKPETWDVSIYDGSWALSHEIRWNGALGPISVAQHSLAVSAQLDAEPKSTQLFALLHDYVESLCGDIVTPVKCLESFIGARTWELTALECVWEKLCGARPTLEERKLIFDADLAVARYEVQHYAPTHWKATMERVGPALLQPSNIKRAAEDFYRGSLLRPEDAHKMFVARFDYLKFG